MENVYLKFTAPYSEPIQANRFKAVLQNFLIKVLFSIFPMANPDFEKLIQNVKEWLVEIEVATDTVNREIGMSETGQILMVMPLNDNCGYWSDNEIGIDYCKNNFGAVEIERKEFEDGWTKFIIQASSPED